MDSLLKADIFFVIAACAVVGLAALFGIALVYLVRILRDVKEISGLAKEQTRGISQDLTELRQNLREKAQGWSGVLGALRGFFGGGKGRKKGRK